MKEFLNTQGSDLILVYLDKQDLLKYSQGKFMIDTLFNLIFRVEWVKVAVNKLTVRICLHQ